MKRVCFSTALGECRLSWHDAGLTGFDLPGFRKADANPYEPPADIAALTVRIQRHLDGQLQDFSDARFDFSLVTAFQRQVYLAALTVPPGQVRSYGWLATALGRAPGSSRAIGHALARNPWPLLIPCHRFIGADGRLTGFSAAGGIATKRRLLDLEQTAAHPAELLTAAI